MIFVLIILFLIFCFWFFSIAPYVPTKKSDLERINKILNLNPWQTFYEIWCWDWRVSYFIAKNNPDKKIVAIEYSILFFLISKIRISLSSLSNINVIYWNALNDDFSKYDVFYIFWLEKTLEYKLKPKFEKEIHNWARVISYVFEINWWKNREEVFKESENVLSIYMYKKPL